MGYKRRELKLCNDGFYDLAKAVLRQYNEDGRPRGDFEGVSLWAGLLQAHNKQMMRAVHNGSITGLKRKGR